MDKKFEDLSDIERSRKDMANARVELHEMEELYFTESKIRKELEKKVSIYDSENEKLRLEIDKIKNIYENSLSWKITSPLRKIKKLLKK